MRVAIVGAGVIGLSSAYFLGKLGMDVTVLERRAGPGMETSFANGAMLHPSLSGPWNKPGIERLLLKSLVSNEGPVWLRLRALPGLLSWGCRFLRSSSPERYALNLQRNLVLARYSLRTMQQLREDTAIQYEENRKGLVVVYRSRAAYEEGVREAAALASQGARYTPLPCKNLIALEPALAPICDSLAGGIHYTDEEGGDAYKFCSALAQMLATRGVKFRFGASVNKVLLRNSRVVGVLVGEENIDADVVVLAAGCHSTDLTESVGLRLPVRPVKGYSLTLPRNDNDSAPHLPVVDNALHAAVVPVGNDRIRVAGTAEFAGRDLRIDGERITRLRRLLERLYPSYAATMPANAGEPWAGLRPMSSDGVPVIGSTHIEGLYLNTGHGHLGWTLAAGSGRLLGDILSGAMPAVPAQPYHVGRFGSRGGDANL